MTFAISFIAISTVAQVTGTFTDTRDAKNYKTVKIGTQTWMAENLAFKADSGCWAFHDSVKYVKTYGYLYNYQSANKACPSGWHLPTDEEWKTLTTFLGGESVAGVKLKESGTSHWNNPNNGATNESGFTALPGGRRNFDGVFKDFGAGSYWWSSTEAKNMLNVAAYRVVSYNANDIGRSGSYKTNGFSVRCVKD